MLTAFCGRFLMAAKTSVKEPIKAARAQAKKKEKVKATIDFTQFQHNRWKGNTLVQLVQALPEPADKTIAARSTWLHKGGYGLKFYREVWTRYPEPCYWTLAKYTPRVKSRGQHARAWGFLTWRGQTEPVPREIPGAFKREWRILIEPGTQLGPSTTDYWTAPPVTPGVSEPKLSTQLPEGLKGCRTGTWPYPWGELGWKQRYGKFAPAEPVPVPTRASTAAAASASSSSSSSSSATPAAAKAAQ